MVSFLMMEVKRLGKEVNLASALLLALVDLCRFFMSFILLYLLNLFSCLCLDQTPFQNICCITWILTNCTAKCLTWISKEARLWSWLLGLRINLYADDTIL